MIHELYQDILLYGPDVSNMILCKKRMQTWSKGSINFDFGKLELE